MVMGCRLVASGVVKFEVGRLVGQLTIIWWFVMAWAVGSAFFRNDNWQLNVRSKATRSIAHCLGDLRVSRRRQHPSPWTKLGSWWCGWKKPPCLIPQRGRKDWLICPWSLRTGLKFGVEYSKELTLNCNILDIESIYWTGVRVLGLIYFLIWCFFVFFCRLFWGRQTYRHMTNLIKTYETVWNKESLRQNVSMVIDLFVWGYALNVRWLHSLACAMNGSTCAIFSPIKSIKQTRF